MYTSVVEIFTAWHSYQKQIMQHYCNQNWLIRGWILDSEGAMVPDVEIFEHVFNRCGYKQKKLTNL